MCPTSPANRQRYAAMQSGHLAMSTLAKFGFVTIRCYDNVRFGGMQAEIMETSILAGIKRAVLLPDKPGH